ncbi:hypothetical protein EDC35_101436 [Thiobaca trueperi]|uniref:Uncharacterized protein n=1 Tax=Thiobaca trueperi TaxID=127458 RepID=A0A4R3N7K4_9GAMM|nr:hypothetical protein EDC35_101436 [Thiobaca trueperi]
MGPPSLALVPPLADPDTHELTDAEMAELRPLARLPGRPKTERPKERITIRFDQDAMSLGSPRMRSDRGTMTGRQRHKEHHRMDRIGWPRAAVPGAHDGIVSTASSDHGMSAKARA